MGVFSIGVAKRLEPATQPACLTEGRGSGTSLLPEYTRRTDLDSLSSSRSQAKKDEVITVYSVPTFYIPVLKLKLSMR